MSIQKRITLYTLIVAFYITSLQVFRQLSWQGLSAGKIATVLAHLSPLLEGFLAKLRQHMMAPDLQQRSSGVSEHARPRCTHDLSNMPDHWATAFQ